MPTSSSVKQTQGGLFYRNLGYLLPDAWPYWQRGEFSIPIDRVRAGAWPSGEVEPYPARPSQRKFYLGGDRRLAEIAANKLELLWETVKEDWENDPTLVFHDPETKATWPVVLDQPYWNDVTLQIAEAIRTHSSVVRLTLTPRLSGLIPTPHDMVKWASAVRERYPFVAVELADDQAEVAGRQHAREKAARYRRLASEALSTVSSQRLHAAIDAYVAWVKGHYVEHGGELTQWGGAKLRQIEFVMALPEAGDVPLCEYNTAKIDGILTAIAQRPMAKRTKKPVKVRFARNLIKEVRQFNKWLHRSPDWDWTRPLDYEVAQITIRTTPEERIGSAVQVVTYDFTELRLLWEYATPFDRLLMLLGLNCGFGRGEVTTLYRRELYLRSPNPVESFRLTPPTEAEVGDWIMRTRRKTGVFGIWRLWPLTARALDWWLTQRPESDSPYLLLTERGAPLAKRTSGGRQNSRVANRWAALMARVRKDHAGLRSKSFGKLRKTGGDAVRMEAGAELAYIYLTHGVPFKGDSLVEVYTNKPFPRLHEVLDLIGHRLEAIWQCVPDPFPVVTPKGGPNISRAVIRRIVELYEAGQTINEIAAETGVSRETVRRWVKRHQGRT